MARQRRGLLIVLAAMLLAALVLAASGYGLADLRAALADVRALRDAHPLAVWLLLFALYVGVTTLSLPVATLLTLGVGALYGFWAGLPLVSFASSIGATLSLLISRWLMRDWVEARFGDRLAMVNDGLRRDGAAYLFTLRLLPVFPFFLINLLAGLSPIRVRTFYIVSQVAMLPATALYVNAGTRLGEIERLSDVASPAMLASLAALGLLPWAARVGAALVQRSRRRARWPMPRRFDRNLVVIGGGAAGLIAAYAGATLRARVTMIEAERLGGDCLNFGCVPSKALIRAAHAAHEIRTAHRFGLGAAAPEVSFRAVFARVEQAIADIAPHDSAERYRALGVEVIAGHARLVDPWTVEVARPGMDAQRLTTRAVVLATGAAPVVPPIEGLDETGYLTAETLWQAFARRDAPPGRLVILGGGPVGVELAQALSRLGAGVTLVEMAPRVLTREDPDVSEQVQARLLAEGVGLFTGQRALACGHDAEGKWILIEGTGGPTRLPFDELIVAVGRAARLKGFGLEELGIPADRVIETNAWLETLHPNILAAGDAAGPLQMTHVAAHQGWHAALNGLARPFWRLRPDMRAIPQAVFTDPEVARVGLNETEAQRQGTPHEVTRYDLADLDRAITDGATGGFVKVLTAPGSGRILGATIVGARAGEMIAPFALAMRHGLGLGKILATVHAYPTWAEANRATAGLWRRAHASPRLMALLERFHGWRRGGGAE